MLLQDPQLKPLKCTASTLQAFGPDTTPIDDSTLEALFSQQSPAWDPPPVYEAVAYEK